MAARSRVGRTCRSSVAVHFFWLKKRKRSGMNATELWSLIDSAVCYDGMSFVNWPLVKFWAGNAAVTDASVVCCNLLTIFAYFIDASWTFNWIKLIEFSDLIVSFWVIWWISFELLTASNRFRLAVIWSCNFLRYWRLNCDFWL